MRKDYSSRKKSLSRTQRKTLRDFLHQRKKCLPNSKLNLIFAILILIFEIVCQRTRTCKVASENLKVFTVLEYSFAKWERFIISGDTVDGYEFTSGLRQKDIRLSVKRVYFQCGTRHFFFILYFCYFSRLSEGLFLF